MEIKSKRALVLNYAAISHINAELPLCTLLKKKGYTIHICSYYPVKDYILQQGLQFYQMNTYPFGMGYESSINSQSKNKYLDELIDRFTNRMYVQRSRELHRMVDELRPSIILIDVFLSTDFIILYKIAKENKIKICFLQTALSSYYEKNSALSIPLFSSSVNSDPQQINKEWKKFFVNRAIMHLKEILKYIGRNDLSLIRKKLKENGISTLYSIDMEKTFHISFNNIPEIVLSPFFIEHTKQKHRSRQFYANLGITLNRREIFDKNFYSFKKSFLEKNEVEKKSYTAHSEP